MYNVYFFGWDGDCMAEWLKHGKKMFGASGVHTEVMQTLCEQPTFCFAIIIDIKTEEAVQITKEWILKTHVPDAEMIQTLLEP